MASKQSRRQFLTRAAAFGTGGLLASCATTPPPEEEAALELAVPHEPTPAPILRERRVLGPNEHIRCGIIGAGSRGASLLQTAIGRDDVDVVAVTDSYDVWRERAVGWCKREVAEVGEYIHYGEMFENEELDAVIIATPDHIHADAILAALDRSIDVYVEKPMTLTWQEAYRVRNRVYETGAVLQVGTQLRATDMYMQARDIIASGRIGDIVSVRVNRDMGNGMVGLYEPPAEANRDNVHWEAFLGDTPYYTFDPRRYFSWRFFHEYSNGVTGDLMLHHLDVCHFMLGCGMPNRVMSLGDIYQFDDGRTCPDTISAIIEYPEGFQFMYTTTLANNRYGLQEHYLGTKGTIEFRAMGAMTVYTADTEENFPSGRLNTDALLDDFFSCMRTRATPIASVEAGFAGSAICHMAVLSQDTGNAIQWDHERGLPFV